VKAYDKDDGGGGGRIVDYYLIHQHYLQRYSTHEANTLLKILDTSSVRIKELINRAKAVETKEKYRRISAEIRRIQKELSSQLYETFETDGLDLIDEETRFVDRVINKDLKISLDLELPAAKQVWAAASFGSYSADGHETFETYLDGLSENLYKVWDSGVRAGYLAGLTARQINRAVLGSVKDMELGQIQGLRRSLERNTRTMIASLAETARDSVYRENKSLFDYYIRLETLDSRTCLACGAEDQKHYPDLEKAPTLPAHTGCRGLYLPHVKGMPEYLEGDERAAESGPVSAKMSYQDWLAQQDSAIQEEILGKYRYQADKDGVPVTSFVDNRGNKLSLAELQQKEGLPFYKTLSGKQREEFQEQSNAVYNGLTNAQRASLHDYTTYFHHQINGALYGVEPMDVFIKEKINDIEISMDKFSVGSNMTLFSGTNREHYKDWKAGEIRNIEGYVSTSVTKRPAEIFYKREAKRGNSPLMLEIRAPKGTRGLYIGNNTGFHSPQNEFLLGKGLRYRVIDTADNLMILEVIK
jgi:hypothetical protein